MGPGPLMENSSHNFNKSLSLHQRSFVTNLDPSTDTDRMLRIAASLGIRAWLGAASGGFDGGEVGFYVHYKVRNLGEFWERVNAECEK